MSPDWLDTGRSARSWTVLPPVLDRAGSPRQCEEGWTSGPFELLRGSFVPGELEKEADVHYQAGVSALASENYQAAADAFNRATEYARDYRDAADRGRKAQRKADEIVAERHYGAGREKLSWGDHVGAFKELDAAASRVSDWKDVQELRRTALDSARFKVGLFLWTYEDPGSKRRSRKGRESLLSSRKERAGSSRGWDGHSGAAVHPQVHRAGGGIRREPSVGGSGLRLLYGVR